MPYTTHCLDCGAETPIIGRRIGFFGLQEIRSRYCRDCIGSHAHEVGCTPEELVAELDEAVHAVKESRREYEERKRVRANRRTRATDTASTP